VSRRGAGVALAFGVAFGFLLSWGTLTDPATIERMLRLQEAYVFLMMGAAVAVAWVGVRLLLHGGRRALLTGEPVRVTTDAVQRRHIVGSVVFGLGWAVADACPGPVLAQLGQGLGYAVCTAAGVTGGVLLFQSRRRTALASPPRLAVGLRRHRPKGTDATGRATGVAGAAEGALHRRA
jgi:uncharacterized membrane protein YedE/YeeE